MKRLDTDNFKYSHKIDDKEKNLIEKEAKLKEIEKIGKPLAKFFTNLTDYLCDEKIPEKDLAITR